MTDDYLWDRQGAPDPDVERLERALGGLRYEGEARPPVRTPRWRRVMGVAAAALLVVGVALALRGHEGPRRERPARAAWSVEVVDAVTQATTRGRLAVGAWLETGATDRASVDVADIGRLDVMPGSRLQLIASGAREHRLRLARGAIHAVVSAPPRLFVVETPAADAVDLGCEYTLEVDDAGNGRLEVAKGWVALERDGRAVTVPYDAGCAIRPDGPGTPVFGDAPAALKAALARLDVGPAAPDDLDVVLAAARKRDTLTLWHLLPRHRGAERARVHDRMAALVPPPREATRAGTLALEPDMLALWFEELRWEAFD